MFYPHTASRRAVLRPARGVDQPEFFASLLRTGIESFAPATIPDDVINRVNDAAFIVTRPDTGEALGFSALFGMTTAGFLKCGVYLDPRRTHLGLGSEVIYLSINYAFAAFDIERVVGQTTEASFERFGLTLDRVQRQGNGSMRDHLYFRGRTWDLYTFATRRAEWDEAVDVPQVRAVLPPGTDWRTPPGRTASTIDAPILQATGGHDGR